MLIPAGANGRLIWIEDGTTIQALVAGGCGYGLLPRLAVTAAELPMRVLEGPQREIHLVWQRERAPNEALRHFVDVAENELSCLQRRYEHSNACLNAA